MSADIGSTKFGGEKSHQREEICPHICTNQISYHWFLYVIDGGLENSRITRVRTSDTICKTHMTLFIKSSLTSLFIGPFHYL